MQARQAAIALAILMTSCGNAPPPAAAPPRPIAPAPPPIVAPPPGAWLAALSDPGVCARGAMRARLRAMCAGRATQAPEAASERLSELWRQHGPQALRDREEVAIDILCLDPEEPSLKERALAALLYARRRAKDDATGSALAAEIVDPDDTIDDAGMDERLRYSDLTHFIRSPKAIPACQERALGRLKADYARLACANTGSDPFGRDLSLHGETPPKPCESLSLTLCYIAHENPIGGRLAPGGSHVPTPMLVVLPLEPYCSTYTRMRGRE